MSNCIKDLFDYDLVKKCCRCKNILLKYNFHKNKNMSDGLHPRCISCSKKVYIENRDRLVSNQRLYDQQNRDKINTRVKDYYLQNHDKIMAQKRIYSNNRYKTDDNFRLMCKTRSRIHHALNSKTK